MTQQFEDDLVEAAKIAAALGNSDDWYIKDLSAVLSLPRRTEADIRADERERLAKVAGSARAVNTTWPVVADWLRSQDNK